MMKMIMVLIVVCVSQIYSQVQVNRVYPYTQPPADFNDVYFITKQFGFLLGGYGALYATYDGGNTWENRSIPAVDARVGSLTVYNDQIFYAIVFLPSTGPHYKTKIYKSLDAGLSWEEYVFPFNISLRKIIFVNSQIGYAVGAHKSCFKTTDAGETWNLLKSDSTSLTFYSDIQFVNENIGWITSYDNIRTTDGGLTWIEMPVPPGRSSHFINENIGYYSNNYYLWKTTNGGINWQLLSSAELYKIQVFDENTFIGLQRHASNYSEGGSVVISTNGGASYTKLYEATTQNGTPFKPQSFSFIDTSYGFILSDLNYLLKTTDRINFTELFGYIISSAASLNKNTVIVSERNYLFKSYNSGKTWQKIFTSEDSNINYLHFKDSLTGFMADGLTGGYSNKIYRTTDGGYTWYEVFNYNYFKINKMRFTSKYIGWFETTQNNPALFKTIDGGLTWNRITIDFGTPLRSFDFLNDNYGGCLISGEGIQKTYDGGNTWTLTPSNIFFTNGFKLLNENEMVSLSEFHQKSIDGGLTWQKGNKYLYTDNGYERLRNSKILDINKVLYSTSIQPMGGEFPYPAFIYLKMSLMGGDSIKIIKWNNDVGSIQLSFSDNNNGWFSTGRKLYKIVIDAPIPVQLTSFTASVQQNSVHLKWQTVTETNNSGFSIERQVLSSEDKVLRPESWESIGFIEGNGTTTEPKEYSFIDENVESGKYKYRLKQIDFDGSFEYSNEIEVEINTLPIEFTLYQNYPNPFNPATKIKYAVPSSLSFEERAGVRSFVTLKVFDILGNEVTTLINEAKEPGEYEIEFDGSSYSSGVYFYTLSASGGGGEFTATKKFVLMK